MRWPSDLAPEQFVPDWSPAPEDAAGRLRDHLDELDKHLAHLTWQRIDWSKDAKNPTWEYPELAEDILRSSSASPNKRNPMVPLERFSSL
jgi:hypothetical protein